MALGTNQRPLAALVVAVKHRASNCSLGLPNATGFCRLRAFQDNSLDTNRSAWASLNLSLGTVVSLTATPDVGDDKNTITAKRAKLHFTRTGSLANSLTVSFLLPTNGLASPVDNETYSCIPSPICRLASIPCTNAWTTGESSFLRQTNAVRTKGIPVGSSRYTNPGRVTSASDAVVGAIPKPAEMSHILV